MNGWCHSRPTTDPPTTGPTTTAYPPTDPATTDGPATTTAPPPVSCSTEGVECEYTEDNLIDSLLQVASVAECRQLCQDEDTCEYITYFDSSVVL